MNSQQNDLNQQVFVLNHALDTLGREHRSGFLSIEQYHAKRRALFQSPGGSQIEEATTTVAAPKVRATRKWWVWGLAAVLLGIIAAGVAFSPIGKMGGRTSAPENPAHIALASQIQQFTSSSWNAQSVQQFIYIWQSASPEARLAADHSESLVALETKLRAEQKLIQTLPEANDPAYSAALDQLHHLLSQDNP